MTVCLVTGKFKVLHVGHLRLFNTASNLADELIVALDTSGLQEEEITWRLNLIKNISKIKEVRVFSGDVSELINRLKPDYVVKGMEFSKLQNVEEKELAKYGGQLVFSSGNYFYSENSLAEIELNSINHHREFIARRNLVQSTLIDGIKRLSQVRVCVIGDLIIDEYVECKTLGMSQEDPAIVVTPTEISRFVGGAGILAMHCASLGAITSFISVSGNDDTSNWARRELEKQKISLSIYSDINRKSTLKTRYRSGSQVLLRLNHFTNEPISAKIEKKILEKFQENLNDFDLVIFSDFSYGLLGAGLVNKIISLCKSNNIMVAGDSQTSSQVGDLSKFYGADLITPTEKEARVELRDEVSGLVTLADNLRFRLGCKIVILKLGADGVLIHALQNISEENIDTDQIKALNSSPINVSGAGDALLAATALALASGSDAYESAYIGSLVAAIHVSQLGNTPINLKTLMDLLNKL
jgi:rfaE bifunctional protein kinase chain/domain